MSRRVTLCLILVYISVTNAYEILKLKNPTTKYGYVYPNRAEPNSNVTYVIEGVDVLIYLAKVPENYADCKLTTQDAEITISLDPNGETNSKVEFWTPKSKTNGCGARIKNVTVTDSGRWKLQAVNEEDDHLYQSFINLRVIKNFDRPDGDFIIREGAHDEFNITKYASYCEISNPVISGNKIFDKCQVDLENINRLYAGKWKANVGVLGKIDEIILQPRVEVLGEYFDVGQNKTEGKINLYCNLINSINARVSFCRFIKDGNEYGFRLSEGLSNGNYSYFGRQLKDGDCGITIENPKPEDYGVWKCVIGIHRQVDKKTIEYEVKEAIISLQSNKIRSKRSAGGTTSNLPEIIAGIDNPLYISYQTNYPIKYCIIKHPNGTNYVINREFENQFWKTTGKISIGLCDMTIFDATVKENGQWQMQIGHLETHILDDLIYIPVRIGDTALIAVTKTLTADWNSQLTIRCKAVAKTSNILKYCRFTLPDGVTGFKIDEFVTNDDPIAGLYWYNGTSLDNGDCQVTIKNVGFEHYGTWKCSAEIQGSKGIEDEDTIEILTGQLSIASISGISVGAAAVVIIGVGLIIYFRRKKRGQQPQRRQTFLSASSRSSQHSDTVFQRNEPLVQLEERRDEQEVEEIEMNPLPETQSSAQPTTRTSESHPSQGQSRPLATIAYEGTQL